MDESDQKLRFGSDALGQSVDRHPAVNDQHRSILSKAPTSWNFSGLKRANMSQVGATYSFQRSLTITAYLDEAREASVAAAFLSYLSMPGPKCYVIMFRLEFTREQVVQLMEQSETLFVHGYPNFRFYPGWSRPPYSQFAAVESKPRWYIFHKPRN